jgi:membrane peptidoglycan carboxypeptidase
LQDWRRQGYPFGHLVPSYGTAIGSSGDRRDALAKLMGIILDDGVRLPTVDIERLEFAAGTPYETDMAIKSEAQRVLSTEVSRTVRRALLGVVEEGTAKRLNGGYRATDGTLLPVGGKTGTGDNRFDRFGGGGRLISQRWSIARQLSCSFSATAFLARSLPMSLGRSPRTTILRAPSRFSYSRRLSRSSSRC